MFGLQKKENDKGLEWCRAEAMKKLSFFAENVPLNEF